jgi:hypothetical protein
VDDHRELVAAEAVAGDVVPQSSEQLGEGDEEAIALRMAMAVVELLEVVDVEEAQSDRGAVVDGVLQRVSEILLVRAVIPEASQAVRSGCAQRHLGAEGVALEQREREQRSGEQDEQRRPHRPQRDRERGDERHDREGWARVPEVVGHDVRDRTPSVERHRDADEHDVEPDEDSALDECETGERSEVAPREGRRRFEDRERGHRRRSGGDRVHRDVEQRPENGRAVEQLRDRERQRSDQDAVLPAEQNLAGDDEDERERDQPVTPFVEGDRLQLGQDRQRQEDGDAGGPGQVGRIERNRDNRRGRDRDGEADDAEGIQEQPRRITADRPARRMRRLVHRSVVLRATSSARRRRSRSGTTRPSRASW